MTANESTGLEASYKIAFAVLLAIQLFAGVREGVGRGASLSVSLSFAIGQVLGLLAMTTFVALAITAIRAIWIKEDRDLLFARTFVVTMAVLEGLLLLTSEALRHAAD